MNAITKGVVTAFKPFKKQLTVEPLNACPNCGRFGVQTTNVRGKNNAVVAVTAHCSCGHEWRVK